MQKIHYIFKKNYLPLIDEQEALPAQLTGLTNEYMITS